MRCRYAGRVLTDPTDVNLQCCSSHTIFFRFAACMVRAKLTPATASATIGAARSRWSAHSKNVNNEKKAHRTWAAKLRFQIRQCKASMQSMSRVQIFHRDPLLPPRRGFARLSQNMFFARIWAAPSCVPHSDSRSLVYSPSGYPQARPSRITARQASWAAHASHEPGMPGSPLTKSLAVSPNNPAPLPARAVFIILGCPKNGQIRLRI